MRHIKRFCQKNYVWLGLLAAFTLAMLIALAIIFCDGKIDSARAETVFYRSCAEAKVSGSTPLRLGESGYRAQLDRDNDGLACE